MAISIKMKVDTKGVSQHMKWIAKFIKTKLILVINKTTIRLQKHIRDDLFAPYPGGTTATTLSTRSGMLKKSVRLIPATEQDGKIVGGVSIGTVYGRVHFGKRGDVTTIKGNPWLKIPLPPVLNGRGLVKNHEKLFWRQSKTNSSDLVMYGKAGGKDIVPLFVLKHEVKIPVRIAKEDMREYVNPLIGKGLEELKAGLQTVGLGGWA